MSSLLLLVLLLPNVHTGLAWHQTTNIGSSIAEAGNAFYGYLQNAEHMRVMRHMALGFDTNRTWRAELESCLDLPAQVAEAPKHILEAVEGRLQNWDDDPGRSGEGMSGTMNSGSALRVFRRILQLLPHGPSFMFVDNCAGDHRQCARAVLGFGALEARGVEIFAGDGFVYRARQLMAILKDDGQCPTLHERVQLKFGEGMEDQTAEFYTPSSPGAQTAVFMYCEGVNEESVVRALQVMDDCSHVQVVAITPLKGKGTSLGGATQVLNYLPSFE